MNSRYTVMSPTRKPPKAVLIDKTGVVFNVGDTITLTDEVGKISEEFIIAMFSFDCFGELYFHVTTSMEHRNMVWLLENAVNKTQNFIGKAKKLFKPNENINNDSQL